MNEVEIATNIIKKFEGFRTHPYLDSRGVWTVGYGTTVYPDGRKVGKNDTPIDEQKATEYLYSHTLGDLHSLSKIQHWDLLNINQKASLLSLAYNVGTKNVINGMIGIYLKYKEIDKIPTIILKYNKERVRGKLQVNRGLNNRREAEVKLFNSPVEG